jgi:hypothetical protein
MRACEDNDFFKQKTLRTESNSRVDSNVLAYFKLTPQNTAIQHFFQFVDSLYV